MRETAQTLEPWASRAWTLVSAFELAWHLYSSYISNRMTVVFFVELVSIPKFW